MVRPFTDWVLVRINGPTPRASPLFLPTESRVLTGDVLAVGPGRWGKGKRKPLDLQPGERIAFFRENLEHRQGKDIVRVLLSLDDDNHGLLRVNDVLFVLSPEWKGELS